MLCSNDLKLIENTRFLATQAKDPGPLYHHSHVGYNYRLSNVLAAVGIAQLEQLDDKVAARRRIASFYEEHLCSLPGISLMPEAAYGDSNRWLSVISIDPQAFGATCDEVRIALEAQNIEARRTWLPLHKQPIYAQYRSRGGSVAESIFERTLCLPSGSSLTLDDLRRIVDCVKACGRT